MAQASFRRKASSRSKRSPYPDYKSRVLQSVRSLGLAKSGGVLVAVGAIALLLTHWQLFLATVAGISVMALLYFGQQWHWQNQLRTWQYFLKGFNRQLLIAVGGGSLATMTAYLGTMVWTDSDSPGIAIATILQGGVTLLTLALVLWQLLSRPQAEETKFETKIQALTHPQPLQRLMAVRQLTQWVTHKGFNPTYRQQIVEYFRLMLTQEKETMIQDALWESLQTLDKIELTPQPRPSQPIQLPHLQSHRTKIRLHSDQ